MNSSTRSAPPESWGRLTVIALGLSLVAGVILLAFAWPAVAASPRDLPVGLVGTDEQVAQVGASLAQQSDGAIEVIRISAREDAVTAIERREVYGAIVLPAGRGQAPEVLKATAASPPVAQLLDGVAGQLQAQVSAQLLQAAQAGQQVAPVQVKVTDVVPLANSDARGAGLAAAMFPVVLAGMIGGTALSMAVRRGGLRRVFAVAMYALSTGFVLVALLQGAFGALQGNFGLNVLAVALIVTAITASITGLRTWFGNVGLGVGAGFMMLLANPISAASVPVEFIVAPWGQVGQWLPPGAGATLIRNLSYFPQADTSAQWWVLAIWAAVGIIATRVSRPGKRAAVAPETKPATADVAEHAVPAST